MQIVYQDAISNGKYNVCYTYLTKHGTLNSINLKFERQAVKFFRGQASSFTHLLIEQRRRRKAWHGGGCSEIVQSGQEPSINDVGQFFRIFQHNPLLHVGSFLGQLNKYETNPYFLQFFQSNKTVCLFCKSYEHEPEIVLKIKTVIKIKTKTIFTFMLTNLTRRINRHCYVLEI